MWRYSKFDSFLLPFRRTQLSKVTTGSPSYDINKLLVVLSRLLLLSLASEVIVLPICPARFRLHFHFIDLNEEQPATKMSSVRSVFPFLFP